MECGAKVMRKSARPASETSGPGSCTPTNRCLGGRGCNNSNGSTLFGAISWGHYGPIDHDPKWIPIGSARPPYMSL